MHDSAIIVARLLEDGVERVCAHCERERQAAGLPVSTSPNRSHGICRRHAKLMYAGAPPELMQKMMAAAAQKPDSAFCPDTGTGG